MHVVIVETCDAEGIVHFQTTYGFFRSDVKAQEFRARVESSECEDPGFHFEANVVRLEDPRKF
jgi:hypothetical protein